MRHSATTSPDPVGLIERALSGDRRALARLLTLVERGDPVGVAALERLYPRSGGAHVVGVTGPPGAGKSTLVGALVDEFRDRGQTVGVVAVDPSSPISGGAALADRIRMGERHDDSGVFIRSMASRGHQGGLAVGTAGAIHLLDAAGFAVVIVETVGVGQGEVDVAAAAHTVVVLQVPGLGDSLQTMKAGLLEVADLVVVNKADLPGADAVARDLRRALGHGHHTPPILLASATTGEGVPALADAVRSHRRNLDTSGAITERRHRIAASEVLNLIEGELSRRFRRPPATAPEIARLLQDVAERRSTPRRAAQQILTRLD
jgi:LAO/AO transport system kinase